MVDQATVNAHRKSSTRPAGDLARHLVQLAEMQLELARIDGRQFRDRAVAACALVLAAVALLIGTCTVAPIGLAHLFVRYVGVDLGAALLLAAGAEAGIAAVVGWIGIRRLSRAAKVFQRSRDEFITNLAQVRDALNGHVSGF
jgi:hypothetical protein